MRTVFVIIFFCFIASLGANAQEPSGDFARLEKNVNIRAKGLIQQLNSTKDTLLLKSENLINRVYSVNTNYKREVDLVVEDNSVKIPLKELSKGKHVFVAVQSPVRIVFVVRILNDKSLLFALEDEKVALKNDKE